MSFSAGLLSSPFISGYLEQGVIGLNDILLAQPQGCECDGIAALLEQSGFTVTLANQRDQLFSMLRSRPFDMVILDLMLADDDGFQVCRSVHEIVSAPVMIITVDGDDQEILAGLDAGAADFVIRPVRPYELIARARVILQRASSPLALPGWMLQYDDLVLDLRSRRLVRNGQSLPLTRTELRLLSFFMRNRGVTLTKMELLKNVWNYHDIPGDYNLVESAIKRLRNTIEDDPKNPTYIRTVWGEGYCFGK